MINVLNDGGAIVARVTGHTVSFNGYVVQDDKVIFTVIDTGKNNNTFYNPERKQMFKYENEERKYDRAGGKDRYIQNYRRVQKKY
jgi:hypothetical protein